jgi:hypothetical protein
MIDLNHISNDSIYYKDGPTPLRIQGYLLRFMRYKFSDPKFIQTPELKGFIWTPDVTTNTGTGVTTTDELIQSKIWIEALWKYTPNTARQRPAIVVKRNTINTKRLSIGDQLHGTYNLLGDIDPNEHGIVSDIETMFMFEGSCSLICVGNNGATVESVAYEVWDSLLTYAPVFLDEMHLHDFQVQALEGIGKLEEDKELFAIPVTVSYAYAMGKILRSEAPLLKGFSFEIGEE